MIVLTQKLLTLGARRRNVAGFFVNPSLGSSFREFGFVSVQVDFTARGAYFLFHWLPTISLHMNPR